MRDGRRGAIVVLLAGIFLSGLLPRTVVVPAPRAEYRSAITASVHTPQDDNAAQPLTEGVAALGALLLVAFVVVRLPFVPLQSVRRELRLIVRRVRAPGSLVETHTSTAEGRTTWHSFGLLRNHGTIAG